MTDTPPAAKPRNCCHSYNGYPHHKDCTRKGGRPVTTGETPPRQAGRHGQIWDDCEAQARADGQTMTDFVRDAITRELHRRQRAALTLEPTAGHLIPAAPGEDGAR